MSDQPTTTPGTAGIHLHPAAGNAERVQDRVDSPRLQAAVAALARFGGRADGGVARETLTDIDLEARRYLIERARALGCEVSIDPCANLFFRRPGREALPPVLTGSHIDTQPVGGKLDGAYGVVAGLEVIEALNDAGITTRRPIEVVAWTNEEGSRFGPGAMGSSAFVEPARLAQYRASADGAGVTFGAALDATLAASTDVTQRPLGAPVAACIELHIEQGPVLERASVPLGVVTSIQSVRWFRIVCTGTAAHAGTTPMGDRSDAMRACVEVAHRLYALGTAAEDEGLRLTLGHWRVAPNSVNTIPGRVEFTVDVRAENEALLAVFEQELRATITAHEGRYRFALDRFFSRGATQFPEAMLDRVDAACTRAARLAGRAAPLRLASGAFHDAMYLADHCPTGMIFVPSQGGVSHNAAEWTAPEDLFLGAQALAHVVTALADA